MNVVKRLKLAKKDCGYALLRGTYGVLSPRFVVR